MVSGGDWLASGSGLRGAPDDRRTLTWAMRFTIVGARPEFFGAT
jgi:hypothetical protein